MLFFSLSQKANQMVTCSWFSFSKKFLVKFLCSPYSQFIMSKKDKLEGNVPQGPLLPPCALTVSWGPDGLLSAETRWLFSFVLDSISSLEFFLFSSGFPFLCWELALISSSYSPQATLSHFSYYVKISRVENIPSTFASLVLSQVPAELFSEIPLFLHPWNWKPFTCSLYLKMGMIIPKPHSRWVHAFLIDSLSFCQILLFYSVLPFF